MQKGYIVARVYTSDAEIPIRNALFTVTGTKSEERQLLGARITDESGKTEPIAVDAPDSALSTLPGNEDPFTRVNIRIDHPEFKTYYIEGVQIFAGQVSLVNAPMIPTEDHISFDKKADKFDINEPATL